jgi:hypothetical protein
MDVPEIQYVMTDDGPRIAYQVFGSGPRQCLCMLRLHISTRSGYQDGDGHDGHASSELALFRIRGSGCRRVRYAVERN